MKRLLNLLVIVLLLTSTVPLAYAQEDAENKDSSAGDDSGSSAGTTQYPGTLGPYSCKTSGMSAQDVNNLFRNIYGPGRNFDSLFGPLTEDDEKKEMLKDKEEAAEELKRGFKDTADEDAVATPDGERAFDPKWCLPCEDFPITSGSNVGYFACAKALSTRVNYCDKDVNCLEEIGGEKLSEKAMDVLSSDYDEIYSINGFKYSEKPGNRVPANIDSLIYSDSQKTYDNLLPVFMVAGFFMPTPAAYARFIKSAKAKTIDTVMDWGRGTTAAEKSLTKGTRTLEAMAKKEGSEIITYSEKIKKQLFRGADDVADVSGDALRLTDDVIESAKGLKSQADDLGEGLLKTFKAEGMDIKRADEISDSLYVKARNSIKNNCMNLKGQSGKACLSQVSNLDQTYLKYLTAKTSKDSSIAGVLDSFSKGAIKQDDAITMLKNLGIKESNDFKKALSAVTNEDKAALKAMLSNLDSQGVSRNLDSIADDIMASSDAKTALKRYFPEETTDIETLVGKVGINDNEIINAQRAAADYALSYSDSATKNLPSFDSIVSEMKSSGEILASQEGKLKRLGRIITGTTTTRKQAWIRAFYKEYFVYRTAHAPAASAQANTIDFEVGQEATQSRYAELLDGEKPYIQIYANDRSFVEGWSHILSYLPEVIPDVVDRWVGMMQWRWAGGSGEPVELDIQCRSDPNIVKDMWWIFKAATEEDKDYPGVRKTGPIRVAVTGEGNKAIVDASGRSTHTYVTEIEKKECLPTLIIRTHGVDINSRIRKSEGMVFDLMKSLTTGIDKNTEVEETGEGITFEDYVGINEEDRCKFFDFENWENSVGFGLVTELIPIADIAFAPFMSKGISECSDTDYWVHMITTVPDNSVLSSIQGGEMLIPGENDGNAQEEDEGVIEKIVEKTEEKNAYSMSGNDGEEVSYVSEDGEEVSYELSKKTDEKATYEILVKTDESAERETGEKKAEIDEIDEMIRRQTSIDPEKIAEYMDEQQEAAKMAKKEAKSLWLHGRHDNGLRAGIEVKSCCWFFVYPDSMSKPTSFNQKKNSMVDYDGDQKIMVTIDPGNATIFKRWDDKEKKFMEMFKLMGDWVTRMYLQRPDMGRVLPHDVQEAGYSEESESELFMINKGNGIIEGASFASTDSMSIINCLVNYINKKLSKLGKTYNKDNFGEALGKVETINLEDGTEISLEDGTFVVSGQLTVKKGTENVLVKVNRDVLVDGSEMGSKVTVINTEKAQIMWNPESKTVMLWLHTLFEGEADLFGTEDDNPFKKDTDMDGMTDGQEEIIGSDPNTKDADGDADGDGITNKKEAECSIDDIALNLGSEFRDAMTMLGPILSIETNDTEITFIADATSSGCNRYIRVCDRLTGECDVEKIKTVDADDGKIKVIVEGGDGIDEIKLFKLSMKDGIPMISGLHTRNGEVVDDMVTFDDQPVQKVRGPNGFVFYDPNTGQWQFYNGHDLPMNPQYGNNGMMIAPGSGGNVGTAPINVFTGDDKVEGGKNVLAQLPWRPLSPPALGLFVVFLLTVALLLRRKINYGA